MFFRELVQIKLKADEIWGMLKTEMPNQDLKKRAYFLHGLGSLFNLMIATEGYAVGAKATFIQHCLDSDPHGMGKFAEFASYCFRLRVCDNELVRIAWKVLVHMNMYKRVYLCIFMYIYECICI